MKTHNAPKPAIFIGYRRGDLSQARLLWQALVHRFGEDEVFFDLERLEGGDDFREELQAAIDGAEVFLTVVGPAWVSAVNIERLKNAGDIVRREIELALDRRADGLVVTPVAMGEIRIPSESDLPESLAPWAGLHFETLDQGPAFSTRLEDILAIVDKHCGGLLARKTNSWLLEGLADAKVSKTRFGQDIAVAAGSSALIRRDAAHLALDNWWREWPRDGRPFVLLGEEGDGKSWALADWLAKLARSKACRTSLLYLYSKRTHSADLDQLLELGLNGPAPGFSLKDWLKDPPARRDDAQQPDFLLVIDAFNEHPGLNWHELSDHCRVAPWAGRVAVIALCRPPYWERHLATRAGETVVTWTLGRFDEDEMRQALSKRGMRRDQFRPEVLAPMAKPRYFDMALRLHTRLTEGEVTVERLIYESWREMYEAKWHENRPFGHDEFLGLIRNLAKPYLKGDRMQTCDLPGRIPPGPWKSEDILQDILSARIATENEEGCLDISVDYLALGLGLLLAVAVKNSGSEDRIVLDEIIAKQLHDHPDMDIHSRICGMALYHAMVKRDYPEAGRLALLRAWLDSRNIEQSDLEVAAAYLPLRPETYLNMAGYLWGETDDRATQDVFMAGFLKYAELPAVKEALVPAFTEWLGLMHADGHGYRLDNDDAKRPEIHQKVVERLGKPVAPGDVVDLWGYRLTVTRNEGLMRLGQVAVAVLSHPHVNRESYAKALATGLFAGAVMGDVCEELIWTCRVVEPEVQRHFLNWALNLTKQGQPMADRAARVILLASGLEEAWSLRETIPAEPLRPNSLRELYEQQRCTSRIWAWTEETYRDCLRNDQLPPDYIAEQMRKLVPNPAITVPEEVAERLNMAGAGLDLSQVAMDIYNTSEQRQLEKLEPALCAYAPSHYAQLMRLLAREMPKRSGIARRQLSWELIEHLPVLGHDERAMIEAAWRDAFDAKCDEDRWTENMLATAVLFDLPAEEQFQRIMLRPDDGVFRGHEPRLRPMPEALLPSITAMLADAAEVPTVRMHLLLGYLAQALSSPRDEFRPELLALFRHGDTAVRAHCMEVFLKLGDRQAVAEIIREGWRYRGTKETWYEDEMGGRILCRYGQHLAYAEVAARIGPSLWGYAVCCRGTREEDLTEYARLLDATWRHIGGLPHEQEADDYVPELEGDRSVIPPLDRFSARRIEAGDFRFAAHTWGGKAGLADPDQLREISNPDAEVQKVNAANERIVARIDAMRAAGNPWFLHSFQAGLLDKVVALSETPWQTWVAPVLSKSDDGRRLLALCRGFYEKLCAALLDFEPVSGAALFRAMRFRTIRITDAHSHLPILRLDLFAATDTPPVSALRRDVLNECAFDRDLFEIALMAEMGGQTAWLDGTIDAGLGSARLFEQARALALLGFSSRQARGEVLARYLADHPDSWPRQVAEAAYRNYRRHTWARHWFKRFLEETDRVRAWAAFRLFLRCVDRRYLIWLPETELDGAEAWKQDAFAANRATLDKAAKENEKDWAKNFLGQKEMRDQVWPWMERYRLGD